MNAPEYQLFSYSTGELNVVDAKHALTHQLAGELIWSENTGLVEGYDINPEHRSKGIVKLLWSEAHTFARDNDLTHPRGPER